MSASIAQAEKQVPFRRIFWGVACIIPISIAFYTPVYTPSRNLYTQQYIRRQYSFVGNTLGTMLKFAVPITTYAVLTRNPHFN